MLQWPCCLLFKFVQLDTAAWGGIQCEMCLPLTKNELVCDSAAQRCPQAEPPQVLAGLLTTRWAVPAPWGRGSPFLPTSGRPQAVQGGASLPDYVWGRMGVECQSHRQEPVRVPFVGLRAPCHGLQSAQRQDSAAPCVQWGHSTETGVLVPKPPTASSVVGGGEGASKARSAQEGT